MSIILPKALELLPEFVPELRFPFSGKTDFVGVCRLISDKWQNNTFELSQAILASEYFITRKNRKYFDLCFVELKKGNVFSGKASMYALRPSIKRFVRLWASIEPNKKLFNYSEVEFCTKAYIYNGKTFINKKELRKELGVKNETMTRWNLKKQDIRSLIVEEGSLCTPPLKKHDFSHKVKYNKNSVKEICDLFETVDKYSLVDDSDNDPEPLPELMEYLRRLQYGNTFLDAYYTKHPFGRYFCHAPDLRYNKWQLMPKSVRGVLFSGYFEYDIETAAPNILIQYAEQNGFGSDWPYIRAYISNKDYFREHLADILCIDLKGAKKAMTAWFFGSRVPSTADAFWNTQFYDLINDYSKDGATDRYFDRVIEMLNTTIYGGMLVEIQKLFKLISEDMLKRADDQNFYFKDGVALPKRHVKMSKGLYKRNSLVAAVYQHEESKILEALMEKYEYQLLLHDAFVSQHDYDVDEMQEYVLKKTGYKLSFVQELLEDELTERLKKYVKS